MQPGQTCRLEIDYLPPENVKDLDPIDWHSQLEGGSPFADWENEYGWVFAKGPFGSIQWVKEGAGKPDTPAAVAEDGTVSDPIDDSQGQVVSVKESLPSVYSDLDPQEWGVVGKWAFPIMIKSKKQQQALLSAGDATMNGSIDLNASWSSPQKNSFNVPMPMFINVSTCVMPPQIDADTKMLDFGQISVGTRQLKTFKIFNKTFDTIKLQSVGLNAIGPFVLIRPLKFIASGESTVVVVECLPLLAGLVVEVLEFFVPVTEDGSGGGHRIRVTMKVQGLKPAVQLVGLSPPPPSWSSRTGVVDFGHVLVQDLIVKKFSIVNKSTFAVDARIVRVAAKGLPPSQQRELIERSATGLPLFSIRPERVQIPQGASQEIEVTFRPDRGRFSPFREDVDVMIGETDEILRVGIFGRAWGRQLFVTAGDPRDEAFVQKRNINGGSSVEDTVVTTYYGPSSVAVKEAALKARLVKFPEAPELLLEFPDPFNANADPALFVEGSSNVVDAAPAKGAKGAPAATGVASVPPGFRRQTKQLQLSSIRVTDGRVGAAGTGTFEIVLSAAAKESGIWSLSSEKGAITASTTATPSNTSDVVVDVLCTQPKPRSLGGIFVGSWKSFPAEVVLKGGWCVSGESDEVRVPIILKAFVSL